jgi:protein gp37
MADNTKIQWTEATWSPVTGCTRTSSGCLKCYIDRTPPFRMAGRKFNSPDIGGTTGVILHPDRLTAPMRWRKPRRIFVCSLADLFHQDVPGQFIAEVFAVMALSPQHTYQVLTKRHARLRSLLSGEPFRTAVEVAINRFADDPAFPLGKDDRRRIQASESGGAWPWTWPLPNVWVGVSAEDQEWADVRIPALLDTPAAVRWVSAEPLLGPISLRREWIGGPANGYGPAVQWLVAGGESGPNARWCDPDWIRSLVDQCRDGVTAPFVKQLGSGWARDWSVGGELVARSDPKGGNWDLWPDVLRIREYPTSREAVAA